MTGPVPITQDLEERAVRYLSNTLQSGTLSIYRSEMAEACGIPADKTRPLTRLLEVRGYLQDPGRTEHQTEPFWLIRATVIDATRQLDEGVDQVDRIIQLFRRHKTVGWFLVFVICAGATTKMVNECF